MKKQHFELEIEGVDYSQYITYPVEIREENLTEIFNTYEVKLRYLTQEEPMAPNQKVRLRWYEDGILVKDYFAVLAADGVRKEGNTDNYEHSLTLLEYTHYLALLDLPNMTITRVDGYYEPTLKDVAEKILKLSQYGIKDEAEEIILDTNTADFLDRTKSPEWTFTRLTAFEALQMVFNYARVVPVMKNFKELKHEEVLNIQEIEDKAKKFSKQESSYNPESYRTRLISNVSNFVAGERSAVSEMTTVRSESGGVAVADDAYIPTTRPIYKLLNFEIERHLYFLSGAEGYPQRYYIIPKDIIPKSWYIDPFKKIFNEGTNDEYSQGLVVSKDVYDTLLNESQAFQKGGSFYYEQGKEGISGLTYAAPKKGFFDTSTQAWKVVSNHILNYEEQGDYPNLNKTIKPEYQAQADAIIRQFVENEYNLNILPFWTMETFFGSSKKFHDTVHHEGSALPNKLSNIYDITYIIDYVPYIETDLYSYKAKKNNEIEQITTQTYNQQANVISSEVLGELHNRLSKSNLGVSQELTLLHKGKDEMLRVGWRLGDYIITASSFQISQYGISARYQIDEFYQKMNKYVAVLEKWRQFSIPSENIVRRQITNNLFAKISNETLLMPGWIDPRQYIESGEDVKVNYIKFTNYSWHSEGITLPATSYPFNNSLVFEGAMLDNAVAGYQSVEWKDGDVNKRENKAVKYADENGHLIYFNDELYFTLFNEIKDTSLEQINKLPYSDEIPVNPVMRRVVSNVLKDGREQLTFSTQIHHIDLTGKVNINNFFSRQNGLVGGKGLNHEDVKIFLLYEKPRSDIINTPTESFDAQFEFTWQGIKLPTITGKTGNIGYAVGNKIGTNTYEILYWVEENIPNLSLSEQLWINFDDKF